MEVLVRTAVYLGTLLLLGAGFFARWIGPDLARRAGRRSLRAGLLAGTGLVILGSLVEAAGALTRAVGNYEAALLVSYVLETRHGNAVLIRSGLAVLLLLIGLDRPRAPAASKALHAGLGIALLATFSLSSHAAGLGRQSAVLADLIHLTGAAAWGGALIYLAWLPVWSHTPGRDGMLAVAVRRVSQVGLVAVTAMVATGIYASLVQLWGPPALTTTPYGQALIYKIALVCIVFVIAGVNRWALVPATQRRRPGGSLTRLGRMVRVESIVLVTVLAMTAVLTSRPVPERPASLADVTTFRERMGSWNVNGSLTPRVPDGLNLAFSITDAGGRVPGSAIDVSLVLTMLDHPMAPLERRLEPQTPGVYRAELPLPMAGRWQLAIRLPGGMVRVAILARTAEVSGWRLDRRALAPGLLALLIGAVVTRYGTQTSRRKVLARRGLAAAGLTLLMVGSILLIRSQISAGPAALIRLRENPIPTAPDSLARGGQIYRTHCQACHGVAGAGDGPAAAALTSPPADLRVHMSAGHTDGELFNWITEGMQGTPMPAFRDRISEDDRWHVINFIRTFATPSDR